MMINWLYYLLEANLYLVVAYGCYWLLFRKQTFYTANRVYLLLSTVICFVIPLVQFDYLQPAAPVANALQTNAQISFAALPAFTPPPAKSILTLNKALTAVYCTGALAMLTLFFIKLYSLLKLISTNRRVKQQRYTLVYLDQTPTPFSFFGYLFLSSHENLQETVLRHELVHINQKHSWDIIFTELLKIINWFNPAVYLLQNSLKALHEFEADHCAAGDNQQDGYVNIMISQAYQCSGIPFTNHFSNQQLLKSRIMKLYQQRSGRLARLNYLLALPLCAGLLCASTLAFSKNYGWIKISLNTQSANELALSALTKTNNENYSILDTPKRIKSISKNAQLLLPPPPPAKPGRVKNKPIPPPPAKSAQFKNNVPSPPPPLLNAQIKTSDFPPPPPPTANNNTADKELTADEFRRLKLGDTIVTFSFRDLQKHISRTMRYPAEAQKNNITGSLLTSFTVDKKQEISNISVKKAVDPYLDAEVVKALSAYKGKVIAKPGIYTLRLSFKLEYADGTISEGIEKKADQEKASAGEIAITAFGNKN
ncbi:M56 family metallopeptidase [Mucilaginibacter terrae]|uniref:M56 family metallopeptidase n=1 Tax=Mucilaginibacter terrae TaxID=1955052 RepID=UPI0036302D8C